MYIYFYLFIYLCVCIICILCIMCIYKNRCSFTTRNALQNDCLSSLQSAMPSESSDLRGS